MIKSATYKVKITLLTPLLGSQPPRDVLEDFIAKRNGFALPKDEEELLPELIERGTSVFHRIGDNPALMNYHILGFLKECGRIFNGKINGVKNLRNKIGMYVTITPRVIPLNLPAGGELDYLERPLRSDRMGTPMVIIARSEMVPEGTWFNCGLEVIESEITQSLIEDLFSYGFSHGLGQWRGSGAYGTFRFELVQEAA
jgi:hypothetical protein